MGKIHEQDKVSVRGMFSVAWWTRQILFHMKIFESVIIIKAERSLQLTENMPS